ncbi:MAG: DUF2130 domain-containing protein [Clostridia bacterium]|nr:DUF2130 domain-containing protein [Clostridia bacterium]
MIEIKCPKCGEIIKIGKDQYNALLNEIDKIELDKRVSERVNEIEKTNEIKHELEINKIKTDQETIINELKHKNELLEEKIKNSDKDIEVAVAKATEESKEEIAKKNEEIVKLTGDIKSMEKDLDISKNALTAQYEGQLKIKDEEIKKWKDYRVGDSTKDIGESLEQYCHDKFDEIRAYAYPNAYFEKDNDASGGTKGDFIFRDYVDEDKENEITSIMFEMKNQKEDGTKKNEGFFKKLDDDRNKKKCEYAVLVSTLEPDSNLYNNGIVDVSHKYPKMFVVRPQFFLTIIGLIKNMAKTRFEYRKQVIQYQKEHIDITKFEDAVKVVASKIAEDYDNAGKQYDKVEKMCDDMIKKLTELKEAFRLGQKWIGAAQNQLPQLEIRKLTKDNPTMKEKFEELDNKKKS